MNAQLIAYYANLLIIQYNGLPRAKAHIEALAGAAMIYDIAQSVADAYNLDTAAGDQLDVIGHYAGVRRDALGSDLTDSEYRNLIGLAVVKNHGVASLKQIDKLASAVFENPFLLFDSYNMSLIYVFADVDKGSVEVAAAVDLVPKPAGVSLNIAYTPDTDNIFGYGSYDEPSGASYIKTYGRYSDVGTGGWVSYE